MKQYKKIDIYLVSLNRCLQYECSTTWSETCKQAKKAFLRRHDYLLPNQVKAFFAK